MLVLQLNHEIDLGINLVGSPLIPYSPLFEDNFCPNYGIDGIAIAWLIAHSLEMLLLSSIFLKDRYKT